jgi:hypothetical protein
MRTLAIIMALTLAGSGTAWPQPSVSAPVTANLLPNPSFELTEPPPPTAQTATSSGPVPAAQWLPRTWDLGSDGGVPWRCPDDPARAHGGRRCAALSTTAGHGWLRYGPIPAHRPGPWTVGACVRGTGQLVLGGYEVRPDGWLRLPTEKAFPLAAEWNLCQMDIELPPGCRRWVLDLSTRGPTDVWLDDVALACPGFPALPLPPTAPLGRDADTLLYLPFEEPLNEDAFYVGGAVSFAGSASGPAPSDRAGEGRFGRALALGPDAYVACSATENLDPAQGTIELWFRLRAPGNDRLYRPLVSVPGPEGMSLCKDQYSHISFSFASGWRTLSGAWADGYAARWQPGVWRHLAACWNKEAMQVFVDGKLMAWCEQPALPRALGPELRLGSPDMEIDDLRISRTVRYRVPLPPATP